MPEDHKVPPTTVKEVGIHVGYLREDMQEVKDLLRNHIEIAATKSDLQALRQQVDTQELKYSQKLENFETRLDEKDKQEYTVYRTVTLIVIGGLVTMVLAQWGLDQFFKP